MRGRRENQWWGVALEAPDAVALATFYAGLLDWNVTTAEEGWATVGPPDGVAFLGFQGSPDYQAPSWPGVEGQQQMQMHLDIEVEDLPAAVADAIEHGATLAAYQPQETVRVMLDPVGHPFCLYLEH
jgi:hypothetical protein